MLMGICSRVRGLFRPRRKYAFKSCGEKVQINPTVKIGGCENVVIGDNVSVQKECEFHAQGGLNIGNGTVIAHNVRILTRNHNYDSDDLEYIPFDERYIHKPVTIGDNVWLGAYAVILPGVTIGEGAVIGAGSVVAKNVPPYAVAGGNPVQVLKYRNKAVYEKLKSEGRIFIRCRR